MARFDIHKSSDRHPSHEPLSGRGATLVEYIGRGIPPEHHVDAYRDLNPPGPMPEKTMVHFAGVSDGVMLTTSLSLAGKESQKTFEGMREEIERRLERFASNASVDRVTHPLHRFFVDDNVDDFREDVAVRQPDCVGDVINVPRADATAYDLICEKIGMPEWLPPGLIAQISGPTAEGWRVTSFWRSARQSREFFETHVLGASAQVVREHGIFPQILPRRIVVESFSINNCLFED